MISKWGITMKLLRFTGRNPAFLWRWYRRFYFQRLDEEIDRLAATVKKVKYKPLKGSFVIM